jgi:16S rRNA (guanine527-N7)-methyltransferase
MREKFIEAIGSNSALFGVELSDDAIGRLADYYQIVQEHNDLLHLVAPCSPQEFATRHILESLTLLEFLPTSAKLADIGTGAGLPSIPCLLARSDLQAVLVESKEKKARFLKTAIERLGLQARAEIINEQFEETAPGDARFVTCRALDKFTQKLPQLVKWGIGRELLLFGGPTLGDEIRDRGLPVQQKLMPLSERRYLFISKASK